jgi:hypothetical protein
MSKAATSKTPTVKVGTIGIAQSKICAEKYDTEMVDVNKAMSQDCAVRSPESARKSPTINPRIEREP